MTCAIIGFECFLTGAIVVGRARAKYFTKQFIKENFEDEHLSHYKHAHFPSSGLPDMGSGRFSEKLTYEAWFNFNNS